MRYKRTPEHDRRIACSDSFAGDAWLDTKSGEIVYAVVGYDMSLMEGKQNYAINKIKVKRNKENCK